MSNTSKTLHFASHLQAPPNRGPSGGSAAKAKSKAKVEPKSKPQIEPKSKPCAEPKKLLPMKKVKSAPKAGDASEPPLKKGKVELPADDDDGGKDKGMPPMKRPSALRKPSGPSQGDDNTDDNMFKGRTCSFCKLDYPAA